MKKAFSLVELSIVLVILGLLVGGILAGKSLIRASELRAVSSEYQRHLTATHTFRDKYLAVPGDITNATAIWGKDNTNCSGHTGTAATPGTCNGDGDGMLDYPVSASATGEMFQFWKQLSLAGLIEGTYTGLAGAGGLAHVAIGSNAPLSKMSSTGWSVLYFNRVTNTGDLYILAVDYGNTFLFGGENTSGTTYNSGSTMRPAEAWNIDTKLDDGMPATGKVIAYYYGICGNGANATDFTATYRLSSTSLNCPLFFRNAF